MLVRRARILDKQDASFEEMYEHRGCIIGAIQQSTAALEAELWEICKYGAGSHLGSNGIEETSLRSLFPVAELIDRLPNPLARYELMLQIIRDPTLEMEKGAKPYQDVALLIKLRNELVHPKSMDDEEKDKDNCVPGLDRKGFAPPTFESPASRFPNRHLSVEFATWAIESVVSFFDGLYLRLGISSPMEMLSEQFEEFRPKKREAIALKSK